MNYILIGGTLIGGLALLAMWWLGWQLVQQNGRMLLRLEALEKRLEGIAEGRRQKAELHGGGGPESAASELNGVLAEVNSADGGPAQAATDEMERADRFSDRSLANSKIERDGLKVGTVAPEFRLPRLEGGELALSDLRGKFVLLVFSSPKCGPCNALAPKLEKFYRKNQRNASSPSPAYIGFRRGRPRPSPPGEGETASAIDVVMISQGELEDNRAKVKEHGLTFPVVLQKQWEVSRDYAYFATPVAYLIDESGMIGADVAVGVDGVVDLMTRAEWMFRRKANAANTGWLKRLAGWPVTGAVLALRQLGKGLAALNGKLHFLQLKHFKFVARPDDIFIVTYPRSGTTWMQMLLYQLTTDGSMEMAHIAQHSPWFERSMNSAQGFENLPSPRIFKTHLSYGEVPKGPGRYIYIVRDGADVAVSYYNLYRNYNQYKGTFEEFFERFIRGKVHYGSWFDHVEGWRKHRHKLNVLFLTYEQLARDLEGCVRRLIAFCDLKVEEERIPAILERCSFAFMKEHESKFDPALEMLWEGGTQLNSFLRVGQVGAGARELTPTQRTRFEQVRDGYAAVNDTERWPAVSSSHA